MWDLRMLKLRKSIELLNGCYSSILDDDIFVSFKHDDQIEHIQQNQLFNTTFGTYTMDGKMINRTDVIDCCSEYSKVMGESYLVNYPSVNRDQKQIALITKKERNYILLFQFGNNRKHFYGTLND